MTQQVYEDKFGEIFDRPSANLIELRWFDSTSEMSAPEFQSWLTKFVESVERCGRSGVLVDSTVFRMSPAKMDGPWRDANIIPRYNAAGVKRFAFQAFGAVDPTRVERLSEGWKELVGTRLKDLVETGKRLGIAPDAPTNVRPMTKEKRDG